MHTVVSRTQPTLIPHKSTSHTSLRREKERQPSLSGSPTSFYVSRPTYFESYPPKTSPTRSASSSPRPDRLQFPTTEEPESPRLFTRERSRTSPSGRPSNWIDRPLGPRISLASTNEGTPPGTPIDNESLKDLDVMVAAPISGVEIFDALVDGMNGGEEIGFSSSSRIPNHPLYQPPLPTPPPGVVLGGAKARSRQKKPPKLVERSSFSDEDDGDIAPPTATPRRRRPVPTSRSASSSTVTPASSSRVSPRLSTSSSPVEPSTKARPSTVTPASSSRASPRLFAPSSPIDAPLTARPSTAPSPPSPNKRKSLAPSISDIIRAYAPSEAQTRTPLSRASSYSRSVGHSIGHTILREESEPEPELLTAEDEADLYSRSSIDSVADEVQRTLRRQVSLNHIVHPPPPHRHSFISDSASILSPRSDGGAASIYSSSAASTKPPLSPFDSSFMASLHKPLTPSQAVAQYLRSVRLTTLLKLTRSPHASHDNPLTVSLSDLGSQNGFPVLVFLGLGCVRHVMGLYDEMAQAMGLRLITVDRWGLGRTEPRAKSAKGIMQWASVVEEVLDLLHIDTCSVMAHSAGAPYALSFANKVPHRIRGEICLLAPWVGESGGYKWLKYIPNGLLKTAQAAEWKLQTWMIGKPPTMAWEGIGYSAQQSSAKKPVGSSSVYPSLGEAHPRPSVASSGAFSAYDDLQDFEGRFESRSTLGTTSPSQYGSSRSESKIQVSRKSSRGFLGRLKSTTAPQSPSDEPSPTNGKRLKALRSMGSLKSKNSKKQQQRTATSPQIPPSFKFDAGLGLDDGIWTKTFASNASNSDSSSIRNDPEKFSRANGRRSISLTASQRPGLNIDSLPPSPNPMVSSSSSHDFHTSTSPSGPESPSSSSPNNAYQAALGNALIAASHAESARGTHNDLLQILNHDNHPWGFSYEYYPHKVQVWYGDRDEKIAENAVRWMEKTMGEHMCSVRVVKGADHGLMYKSGVVVEVLEYLLEFWR